MLVPILLVLPAQEALRDLALYRKGLLPNKTLSDLLSELQKTVEIPPGVTLAEGSCAIPLKLDNVLDKRSVAWCAQTFTLRCFIEVDSMAKIPDVMAGQRIFSDPPIRLFNDPPITIMRGVARGTSQNVSNKLDVTTLSAAGLDGRNVAIAIMDNGINIKRLKAIMNNGPINFDAVNSWTAPDGVAPFGHRFDHGTMCAFNAILAAPAATLLDVPIAADIPAAQHGPKHSNAEPTLSLAMQGFDWLREFCKPGGPADITGIKAVISSNSWGIVDPDEDFPPHSAHRYIDNPAHPLNAQISDIVGTSGSVGVDIVFAAGNCGQHPGDECNGRPRPIMGSNALPAVLTIAGCDMNDVRVEYSSQGPAMPFVGVPADRDHSKPDVTAYTQFLGSELFGAGMGDPGTSTACPVAAGCVAALRTRNPAGGRLTSEQMIKVIRDTARLGTGQAKKDNDFGCGIIDPVKAAKSLGLIA